MEALFIVLIIQAILGGLDNFWHHEVKEQLPSRISAKTEVGLHSVRELSYGVLYLGIAWGIWYGIYAWILIGLLVLDVFITLWDFIIEDKTRKLPPFERVLHTILTLNFGIIIALLMPILWGWTKLPTGYEAVSYGSVSWAFTLFATGVILWGIRNAIAYMALTIKSVPEWQRHPIKKGVPKIKRRILITGGTGFIGSNLTRMFIKRGHSVWVLTRDTSKAAHKFGPHIKALADLNSIPKNTVFDSIINLAGAPIVGPLWTKKRKQVLMQSRVKTTLDVLNLIRRLKCKPEVLLTASAVGYYKQSEKQQLSESAPAGDDFPARMCQRVEGIALAARREGVRVVPLRVGLVLGSDDGFLYPFLVLAKAGLAPTFGHGRQWLSWIHIEDLMDLILHVLHNEGIEGPINATAPSPVTGTQLAKTLSRICGRPQWLTIPRWPLANILGEMADLFYAGNHVVPKKIMLSGFRFKYPVLEAALENLVKGNPEKTSQETCEVYYNEDCPVCSSEIRVYRNKVQKLALPMRFHDINGMPEALADYGLSRDDIKKRLFAMTPGGELVSGADTFAVIWKDLPGWRWGAKAMKLRPVYFLAAYLYEGLLVPALWFYNSRRAPKHDKGTQINADA